ncbi:unnamed protein product, partial [Amoebophrya sp. A25]
QDRPCCLGLSAIQEMVRFCLLAGSAWLPPADRIGVNYWADREVVVLVPESSTPSTIVDAASSGSRFATTTRSSGSSSGTLNSSASASSSSASETSPTPELKTTTAKTTTSCTHIVELSGDAYVNFPGLKRFLLRHQSEQDHFGDVLFLKQARDSSPVVHQERGSSSVLDLSTEMARRVRLGT